MRDAVLRFFAQEWVVGAGVLLFVLCLGGAVVAAIRGRVQDKRYLEGFIRSRSGSFGPSDSA